MKQNEADFSLLRYPNSLLVSSRRFEEAEFDLSGKIHDGLGRCKAMTRVSLVLINAIY
jgi:hypothetical protein